MLGEFTRQDEADGRLDLAGRDGRLFRVRGELGRLGGDALEDVVDKRVENGHRLVRDTRVGVDLLKDCAKVRRHFEKKKKFLNRKAELTLVDIGRVGLFAGALALLFIVARSGCRLLCGPRGR